MSRIPTSLPSSIAGLGSQIITPPQYVNVADVTADSVMQHRMITHDKVIEEYADVLRNGTELAPIQIIRDQNNTLWLWDGFHTLEAAKRVGALKLRAKITRGTKRDAWLKSLGANAKHGIRRTRADLQKTVDDALGDPEVKFSLLNEDQQHSYNSLAKLCTVHHSTISKRWNNHHLPLILAEIDQLVQGNPPVGVSLQTWLDMVASDLHVPGWLVKQRKIEIGFAAKSAPIPTEEPSAGESLEREIAEHDEAPTTTSHQSDDNLTEREIAEHQPTPTTASRQSDETLTESEIASDQTNRALNPAQEPTELVTVQSEYVVVHDPARNQRNSGQELATILTNVASQEYGVKVIEVRRPAEGWSQETGKEIGRVFADATSDETELAAVLVVLVRK